MKIITSLALMVAVALGAGTGLHASENTAGDLIDIDFETLIGMEVDIQTAGKNTTRVMDSPYAGFVLSAEDIKHSGAQSIPEALRLVPGVSVDRISTSEWGIGIRGAGGRFSRYVLVMLNGRPLYNTVFSGVNWDELNITLNNIERIEVVRGPNAAAWGANAVNGIIHIITYKPEDSGTHVTTWVGDHYRSGAQFRKSFHLDEDWRAAISGNYSIIDGMSSVSDSLQEEDLRSWRMSLHAERKHSDSQLGLLVDFYGMDLSDFYTDISLPTTNISVVENKSKKQGYSLQANYHQDLSEQWVWRLLAANDDIRREGNLYEWNERNYYFDWEFLGDYDRHVFSLGVNYRLSISELESFNQFDVSVSPERAATNFLGIFVADSIRVMDDLTVELAARFDENDLSENAIQPSIRSIWSVSDNDRLWLALTRASSTPSRGLTDSDETLLVWAGESPDGIDLPIVINASPHDLKNTEVDSIEAGFRHAWKTFYAEIAVFDIQYKNDLGFRISDDPQVRPSLFNPALIEQGVDLTSVGKFDTRGLEISARGQLLKNWWVQLAYAYLDLGPGTSGTVMFARDHVFSFHSRHKITDRLQLSWWWQDKTRLDVQQLSGYQLLDVMATWTVSNQIDLSVIAKNLLKGSHVESRREGYAVEGFDVDQNIQVRATWSF